VQLLVVTARSLLLVGLPLVGLPLVGLLLVGLLLVARVPNAADRGYHSGGNRDFFERCSAPNSL